MIRDTVQRGASLLLAPTVAYIVAVSYGPRLIDDAYITFRYAENLAAGRGLVFNAGESVLGTTSPLFAATLALLRLFGAEIPHTARALGMLSASGIVLLVQSLSRPYVGRFGATIIGLGVALHPDLAFTANSGMETGLCMFAVYAAMGFSLRRNEIAAGTASGVACLFRPDGALVAALCCLITLKRSPRRVLLVLIPILLLVTPWLVFAKVRYGGITPHSVDAKRFIHAAAPTDILRVNATRLTYDAQMKILCGLAAGGVAVAVWRRSELLWLVLWFVLYFAGLSASRVGSLFPWYMSPLFPLLFLFAGVSVFDPLSRLRGSALAEGGPRKRKARSNGGSQAALAILGSAVLAAPIVWGLAQREAWRRDIVNAAFGSRTEAYLAIGEVLRERSAPGDRIFVGEVGALAYTLSDRVFLDSSGINSPEILRIRKEDFARMVAHDPKALSPEGTPDWVLEVLRRFEPRFVVTYMPWLHMVTLLNDSRLTSGYRRVALPGLEHYVVLERL